MVFTMERYDQLLSESEQTQTQEVENLDAVDLPITGVQLNKASQMVTIYHRQTGEPRQLPRLAAEIALKKRYRVPDGYGAFIFSAKSTKPYHLGEQKCMLHPDSPDRATYSSWGLPICTSEHLASPGEVRVHMEKRHPSAYKTIKADEEQRRQQQQILEQRALGESIRDAMLKLVELQSKGAAEATVSVAAPSSVIGTPAAPLYVSDKPQRGRKKRKTT